MSSYLQVGRRRKRAIDAAKIEIWNQIQGHFVGVGDTFMDSWNILNDRNAFKNVLQAVFPAKCIDWANGDDQDPIDLTSPTLPPAPCTLRQARRDPRFYQVLQQRIVLYLL